MAVFSNDEYCDIVLLYGECKQNAKAAAKLYRLRFPTRHHPAPYTITKVVRRLRETGSFSPRPRAGRPCNSGMRVHPADILAYVLLNPRMSTTAVSRQCGLSAARVWQILHEHGAYPYRDTIVQHFMPEDPQRRYDFCNFVLNTLQNKPWFLETIIWTDESTFTRSGIINRQNSRTWHFTNPHMTRQAHHQVRWSLNVWCGIWKDSVIGPVFIDGTLKGQSYLELLSGPLSDWLDELPLNTLPHVWFQHDGCPAHKFSEVRSFLTDTFGNNVIGYGGDTNWPPRSPDLTPMDFFFWGYLKSEVYKTDPSTVADLKDRIVNACTSVTPAMLQAVRKELLSRIQMCVVADGAHFEQCVR